MEATLPAAKLNWYIRHKSCRRHSMCKCPLTTYKENGTDFTNQYTSTDELTHKLSPQTRQHVRYIPDGRSE